MKKLIKKIKVTAELTLLSGLHIGASSESVEIGGVDNPVVRKSLDNEPYIPGSSIKGKIRCLLEQMKGVECCGDEKINNLFGSAKDKMPSKIIVRDASLNRESKIAMAEADGLDMPFTEIKFENTINRITGTADNPRQTERVPAGAKFELEFVLNVWDDDKEEEFKELLKKGICALENDYLGGSGSRGYGHVVIQSLNFEEIKL